MKKLALLALAVLLSMGLSAQIKWGVHAGVNYSTLTFPDAFSWKYGYNPQVGYQGGVTFDMPVGKSGLGLNTGLTYIARNSKTDPYERTITDETGTHTVMVTYDESSQAVQLPVNLTFAYPMGNTVPFLMAGPYAEYCFQLKGDGVKIDGDKMASFNYGVSFGAGIDLKTRLGGLDAFRIAYHYDLGLSDIVTENATIALYGAKNRGHFLSVGVVF